MDKLSQGHKLALQRAKRNKIAVLATQIGVLVVALIVWEVAANLGWIDSFTRKPFISPCMPR